MKIFVINMEKDKQRLLFMEKQLSQLELAYEIFPATDGRMLSTAERDRVYDSKWGRRQEGREFTHGEIGCALSHIRLYERIVKENIEAALILEDDCWLTPSIVPFLKALDVDRPWDQFDVLLLSGAPLKGRALWSAGGYYAHSMTGGMFTHAYIVSKRGAETMAKRLFPICHFADAWSWMVRHRVARFAAITPTLATQDQFSYGSATSVGRTGIGAPWSLQWIRYKIYRAFWKTVCKFYSR